MTYAHVEVERNTKTVAGEINKKQKSIQMQFVL